MTLPGLAIWEQCNEVLHLSQQPQQHAAEEILDSLITHGLTRGHLDLPPSDHHYFSHPLGHLLYQSLPYKQAWYTSVTTAHQRQDHCATLTPNCQPSANPHNGILSWIHTGYFA